MAYSRASGQSKQVGQGNRNLYFNRKDDIEQVGNDRITVAEADAREGISCPSETLCAGQTKLGLWEVFPSHTTSSSKTQILSLLCVSRTA